MANNLIFFNSADIFSVYPQIFDELIGDENYNSNIYLPSDVDWQEKMYYMLLEVQKTVNASLGNCENYELAIREKEKLTFDSTHIEGFSAAANPTEFKICSTVFQNYNCQKNINSFWTLDSICKAAQLLKKPVKNVIFQNEHDMRKVYSLLYEVFRYKSVIKCALSNVKYFDRYPKVKLKENDLLMFKYTRSD